MGAMGILCILAAIISCTLTQDPTSLPNYKPGWHRHRTPQPYSSQVVSEDLLRNSNYYPTAGPYWDISSLLPGQLPVYKPGFGSSRVSRQTSTYPSSYPRSYRYDNNPELYSYQWKNMNERTNSLIKAAEQTNNKLEELHSKMMQYFDKEKIILRALVETTTTTKDNVDEE